MVRKTVGNVYLPGVFNAIQDFNLMNGDSSEKMVDRAARMLLEEEEVDKGISYQVGQGGLRSAGSGAGSQPVNLKD